MTAVVPPRPRVFSGIQPTGELHLGSLLGAVLRWVRDQGDKDAFFCIVDLHAITVPKAPGELGRLTLDLAAGLLAAGLDPEQCTLFVQSHVPEHAQLGWLMECTTSFGELSRMTQFKDKRDRHEFVSAGLFTYPALQAADILLYDTNEVPVGDDQRQHLELARDVAERFNHRYGDTFVVPVATTPTAGARVMDLSEPTSKMSKSATSDNGIVWLSDDARSIEKKFKRAVTDSETEVRYDPGTKPGVSNLLDILAAAAGGEPGRLADGYTSYGPLKADCAQAVIALLEPIRRRYAELESDPAELGRLLHRGADKARQVATVVNRRATEAVGFLPPAG